MGQSTNSALTFLSYPYYVHSISFNVDWWLSILLSFSYHVLRYLIHRIPSYNGLFLLSSVIYYCNCHHFLIDITSIYYLIVVQYSIAVVSCHRMLYYRNYSQTDYINICDLWRQCTPQAGLITPHPLQQRHKPFYMNVQTPCPCACWGQ